MPLGKDGNKYFYLCSNPNKINPVDKIFDRCKITFERLIKHSEKIPRHTTEVWDNFINSSKYKEFVLNEKIKLI